MEEFTRIFFFTVVTILFQIEFQVIVQGGKTTTEGTTEECDPILDIVFMLDGHPIVSVSEFEMQKNFIRQLIGHHNTPPGAVKVGFVICGGANATVVHFGPALGSSFNNISYPASNTNSSGTAACLESVEFVFQSGGRELASQIVFILIGDNEPWDEKDTKLKTHDMKAIGITIFVVGIGRTTYEKLNSLHNLASDERKSFILASFQDLKVFSSTFSGGACLTASLDMAQAETTPPTTHRTTTMTSDRGCKHINESFYRLVPFFGWVKISCDSGMVLDTTSCECTSALSRKQLT